MTLSAKDRLRLANELVESVDPKVIDQEWDAEIRRRIEKLQAGESTLSSWEEVDGKIRTVVQG